MVSRCFDRATYGIFGKQGRSNFPCFNNERRCAYARQDNHWCGPGANGEQL